MKKIHMPIDEKKTVKLMKQKLVYLSYYSASIRLQSILYGEAEDSLHVEDDIGDYLHYTKSIVHVNKTMNKKEESAVIKAMMKQQNHKEMAQKKDAQAYVLLEGIAQLEQRERELLFDVFVRQYPKVQLLHKMGGIVESTYHRKLHKAILHLAYILHQEIYLTNM